MGFIGIGRKSLLAVLSLSFVALSVSAKDVLYVKSGSHGDGSSWSQAFGNVQQAVDSAAKRGADVWVAKGVYKSDSSHVVFLKPNVSLYGGFSGTETSLSARDTAKNPTILDGNGEMNVVYQTMDFDDATAVVVDGFTIRNGYSISPGAGLYLGSNTTINNCIVAGNKCSSRGSAIFATAATIRNTQIIDNSDISPNANGLQYTIHFNNNCVLDNCVVKGNIASRNSAVFAAYSKISNCVIEGNASNYYSSAGSFFASTTVSDCKFINTNGDGSSVELQGESVLKGCLFQGNSNVHTTLISVESGVSVVEDCKILDNSVESDLVNSIGKVNRCFIAGNTTKRDAVSMDGPSSSISNCLIRDNECVGYTYDYYVLVSLSDSAAMSNCTVVRNKTGQEYVMKMYNSTLRNSIVVGNGTPMAVMCGDGDNTIVNNMLEASSMDGNIGGTMAYAAFSDAENGDFSLSENSLCINAGMDVPDEFDLFGRARKQGGAVDMGAIESAHMKTPVIKECGEIVYVKSGSQGDGSSWNSAFGDIQQAIYAASADGKRHQVWVAAGSYYGDTTAAVVVNLAPGISLYGGFAGNESSLSVRDTAKNPTILDGRHARGVISQRLDFPDSMAVVVDGFTIQNGEARNGGGVYVSANTTIDNCIIKNNKAIYYSAIYASHARIKNTLIFGNSCPEYSYYTNYLVNSVMDSCVVKHNRGGYYCTLYAIESSVTNCVFEDNSTNFTSAMSYSGLCLYSSKVDNCNFLNSEGSGASAQLYGPSVMSGCLFEGNTNVNRTFVYLNGDDMLMEDCQFLNNSINSDLLDLAYGKADRCVFKGNTVSGSVAYLSNLASMYNSLICDNSCTSEFSSSAELYLNSLMSNCTVVRNENKHENVVLVSNSTLRNSIVVGNKVYGDSSSVLYTKGTNIIVNNMLEGGSWERNLYGAMEDAAFTDAENGDYSLSEKSPCVNSGADVLDAYDLLGKPRNQGGAVDMGAIESAFTNASAFTKCGEIVYVKSGSHGDGSSWNSAFGDLQQAIYAASADGKRHQIWVAAGTYFGDTTLPAVVTLVPGVSLYGGFSGNETSLAARDTAKNPTILDGMNTRCVVIQNYDFADSMAVVVDGFNIQNGGEEEVGGVNIRAHATINNCIVKNNNAAGPTTTAIYAKYAAVKNTLIIGNGYSEGLDHIVWLYESEMDSCLVKDNKTHYSCVVKADYSKVTNCVFESNSSAVNYALEGKGGSEFYDTEISDCKFLNTNGICASVRLLWYSVMSGCSFEGNTDVEDYLIYLQKALVKDCSIRDNSVNSVLIRVDDEGALVEDCQILDNTTEYYSPILSLNYGKIERCFIKGNISPSSLVSATNSASISNCLFCDNSCENNAIQLGGNSMMSNCTVTRNEITKESVLYMQDASLLNSIIVGNKTKEVAPNFVLRTSGNNSIYNNLLENTFVEGNVDGTMTRVAFTDAANGDFSLSEKSCCVNMGTSVADSLDLFGKARMQSGAVDMGAIESSYSQPVLQKCGDIIYVKSGSQGDGSSWTSAFGDIQQAIYAASADGKRHQVWVAAGTYYGDTTLAAVVKLARGISLYGGFSGNETSLTERDAVKNLTILDGQNTRRAIIQYYDFDNTMAVVVDGFFFQNGFAKDGIGMYVKTKGNTTFQNCLFKNAGTGSVCAYAEKSIFRNCQFVENTVQTLEIHDGVVDSCVFVDNKTEQHKTIVYLSGSKMTNSRLSGQKSLMYGLLDAADNSVVSHCEIAENVTQYGDLVSLTNSLLDNSLVYGNKVTNSGASIISVNLTSFVTNTTIVDNITLGNRIIYFSFCYNGYYSTIANSIFYGNKTKSGTYSQVDRTDCIKVNYCASDVDLSGENNIKLAAENNGADTSKNYVRFINAAGDYRLHATSSCIDKGLDSFVNDETDYYGGARTHGRSVDLGAFEFVGEYVEMLDYHQKVCYDRNSFEVFFDSTISRLDWSVVNANGVTGFASTSGSGVSIPSMRLRTSKEVMDTLTLKVTLYDNAGVVGVPFYYNYFVYPDLSAYKVSFVRPQGAYEVNERNNYMTIEWKNLSLPVEVGKYELYVWKASQQMSSVPVASFTSAASKTLYDLDNHATYKYMVKALTACDTICSDIDSFRIDIPVSLEISGSQICEMGTKLNSSTRSQRYVKGFELTDSITYSISGDDAADFSVSLSDSWDSLKGGFFDVNYTPTNSKKPASNAILTFKSGDHTASLYLSGVLANYYIFNAVVENDVYQAGDIIPIKGSVTDAYGSPYEGKLLKVLLMKGGSEVKALEAVSDANGEILVNYESSIFESGVYYVGLCLSGESSDESFDMFNIPGISCNVGTNKWLVQKGDTVRGAITVNNRSNVDAHGIKVKTLSLAEGCKVVFDSIGVIYGSESKTINYYVVGESVTEGNRYMPSTFRVESADGLSADFTSYFYCEMPYGQIKVLPANITEYVSKQNPKYVELTLCNTGYGETGKVTVALPYGFEGMSMPNGTEIGSIKPGDTVRATLKLAYYDGAKLNTPINGSIGINCENGKSTSISYSMEYTSSYEGNVCVDVVDEYYYNSASRSHLAGAKVAIKNAFNSMAVASGITDSTGKVRFDNVPEGDYLLVVKADKHSDYQKMLTVQAGQTMNEFVFISYQAVSYTWSVEPTEIEDKYKIDIEADFETNVPIPVVTAEFPNGIPSRESFNPGEKKVAYLVLTNHGLIAAKEVAIMVPDMQYFRFTPDIDLVDSLPANYSLVVPVTIERLDNVPVSDPTIINVPSPTNDISNQDDNIVYNPVLVVTPAQEPKSDPFSLPLPFLNQYQEQDTTASDSTSEEATPKDSVSYEITRDTVGDCVYLVIKYSYWCKGEKITRSFRVKTWDCYKHMPKLFRKENAGGGGYYFDCEDGDGSVNVGIYTINFRNNCNDTCSGKVDGALGCLMDLVSGLPGVVNFFQGIYSYKELSTTEKAVDFVSKGYTYIGIGVLANDSRNSNDLDPREAASLAYQAGTFIPGLGDIIPFGCLDWWCQAHSCKHNGRFAKNCGEYIYDMMHHVDFEDSTASDVSSDSPDKKESADADGSSDPIDFYSTSDPLLLAGHDMVEYLGFEMYRNRFFRECVGKDEEILGKVGFSDFLKNTIHSFANRVKIKIDEVKQIPVSDLPLSEMIQISERWNRTIDAWNDGVFSPNEDYPNIADMSVLDENIDGITNFYQYVVFRGFDDIPDMIDFINGEMAKYNKEKKSVCASVKLHISQTLAMTREAFDGTLTVNNGVESSDMDNFTIVLDIRDEKGNPANDLFQINTQSLSGVSSVDGTSSIEAGGEATAVFRFIPERGAAPKAPVNYSFGGRIVYLEAGDTITIEMNPVVLTVNPSPSLQIDYFMQRNILADDPLTLDRVEPTVPAALGVRIDNQGYGMAKNVKLETAQPEIVDNEKGLLIDFALIGSSLNGKDCDLGSENIDFGNIDALSAKTGVWWLTSSLLGHFTKYEASVVHDNSFGNPELSLVGGIAIHELFKTVDAYGGKEDGVTDFLVNDYRDSYDMPDAIYYSNGGKDTVNVARNSVTDKAKVTPADTVVRLTVTPSQVGWNYARLADPGENCYEIQKVVRVKDNYEIPLDNVWTTFVTLPDGLEPIYDNQLHFLDYMTTLGANDYDIYFSMKKNLLSVTEITGVPASLDVITTPVDSVVVKFNRKVQKESFDYHDIELYCQAGDNLSDSTVSIVRQDDYTFVVNISSKTRTSGFYKMEVNVIDVFDQDGYPGEMGKAVSWTQLVEGGDLPQDVDDPQGELTSMETMVKDTIAVYAYRNNIYVKSAKAGSADIYDLLSRLVVKDVRYGEGVTCVATLPKGVYIIKGRKLIVE